MPLDGDSFFPPRFYQLGSFLTETWLFKPPGLLLMPLGRTSCDGRGSIGLCWALNIDSKMMKVLLEQG